jgi:hypothetical protein
MAATLLVAAGCAAGGSVANITQPSEDAADAQTRAGGAPGHAYGLRPPADPDSLVAPGAHFSAWAALDRHTGEITGSTNSATSYNTTESMIKPWFVADYLRQLTEQNVQPSQADLDEITLVLVDSNDPLGHKYWAVGGEDFSVRRLIQVCGLTDVGIEPGLWGWTRMTPLDAVRYGACLADGRAAGPQWTNWLLDTMRNVRGGVNDQLSGEVQGGRWGIVDGLTPEVAKQVSFKNGWTEYMDGWHVNCLAIHPDWIIAVMLRTYEGLDSAAAGCAHLASSLIVDTRPEPLLPSPSPLPVTPA